MPFDQKASDQLLMSKGPGPMPYGMPYILGIFAGMGKRAFALFVNLRARALRALDFYQTGRQKRARAGTGMPVPITSRG